MDTVKDCDSERRRELPEKVFQATSVLNRYSYEENVGICKRRKTK